MIENRSQIINRNDKSLIISFTATERVFFSCWLYDKNIENILICNRRNWILLIFFFFFLQVFNGFIYTLFSQYVISFVSFLFFSFFFQSDLRRHQQGEGHIQVLSDRCDVDPRPVQSDTTSGHLYIGSPTVLPLHYHYNIG